ncbi:hypothetical protein HPB50_014405 [Hyalomma asiaticum]|uniref:Uncharacterized protein n=1 Tax=Hyalomma asiaticum TaxID=266040 RepID=A0ACB7TKV4_HYAAI|nr:hypothetical protein HPB50_014405 [Hyalomma asiaticum]
MAQRQRFPTAGHVMWKNDLEVLPHVSDDVSASLCTSVSSRQLTKSYNFAVEAYALPSSVATNTCDLSEGTVYARATCFRSQRKAGKPYKVYLAIKSSSGVVTHASCECPAGASGACSHILATVRLIALLKKKRFKEAPPELSCTDLSQQWRRPRRQGIQPASLQDVDWRSPRQDGAPMPISTRVFDICSKQDDPQEQLDRMHKLGEGLKKRGNHSFGSMLLAAKGPFVETRLGLPPIGSPLSYQQALLPGGFETWVSSDILPGSGKVTFVPDFLPFDDGALATDLPKTLSPDEQHILQDLQVTSAEARELEMNSRQQSRSNLSQQARLNRLTASCFGRVIKRLNWTEKGLYNLIESKDLSRVRAIQYGLRNENVAADRYCSVMKSHGHNVSLQYCGLFVNPTCPWLRASPDRLIYDPEEASYGVLEVKCPYSLKDSTPEVAKAQCASLRFSENNSPSLKKDHEYYAQVMGQMAITKCNWADFVVYSANWIAIERIHFDEEEWKGRREAELLSLCDIVAGASVKSVRTCLCYGDDSESVGTSFVRPRPLLR